MSTVVTASSPQVVHLPQEPSNVCSCGGSQRAFASDDVQPVTQFNLVTFDDAQLHWHTQVVEVYYVFKSLPATAVSLDGERVAVRQHDLLVFYPGCVHGALGDGWQAVLAVTPKHCRFEGGDMHLDNFPDPPADGKRWTRVNLLESEFYDATLPVIRVELLNQPALRKIQTGRAWRVLLVPADGIDATIQVNGESYDLRPGSVCRVPPCSDLNYLTACRVVQYDIPTDALERAEALAFKL